MVVFLILRDKEGKGILTTITTTTLLLLVQLGSSCDG